MEGKQNEMPPPYSGATEVAYPTQAPHPQQGYPQQPAYPPQQGYPQQQAYPPQQDYSQQRPAIHAQPPPPGPAFQNYPVAQPGYNQQPQQPASNFQSNTTVVVSQPATTVVVAQHMPSNAGAIVLSCVTIWCCWPGAILGFIAFVLAALSGTSGDPQAAYSKIRIANILSVIGMFVGGLVYLLWIILATTSSASTRVTPE